MDKFLRLLARLLFAGLIFFELLNQFGILRFSLDFSWLGLVITGLFVWLILEGASFYLSETFSFRTRIDADINADKRGRRPLSGLAMIVAVAAVYLDALGDIAHFYSRISFYDQLAHLVGGGAAAGLVFSFVWNLRQKEKIKIGLWGLCFLSLVTASFFGTLYEIEEYLEDKFTGSHRLGDGPDTANDLLMNILGSLIVLIFVGGFFYRKTLLVHN